MYSNEPYKQDNLLKVVIVSYFTFLLVCFYYYCFFNYFSLEFGLICSNHNYPYIKHLGPYSWKILVLRVATNNKILRKFLEMWVFPLKIKEKFQVKKKVIQKAS